MPRNQSKTVCLLLAMACIALLPQSTLAGDPAECSYYHEYLGNNPKGKTPGWHNNAQGLSHDDTHWYLSQAQRLWRVPVEQDLNISPPPFQFVIPNYPPYVRCEGSVEHPWAESIEVPCTGIPAELAALGRNHFGDITVHDGYVFVPIDGKGVHIGVFRADETLAYVGAASLDYVSLGWLAMDPDGRIYVSKTIGAFQTFEVYGVDWDLLRNHGEVQIDYLHELTARNEVDQRIFLTRMQGGVFSDDGRQLYLVNGFIDETKPDDDEEDWGIHVFDVTPGDPPFARRVARSTNGSGPFNFQFNPGLLSSQAPEGATYWDLDAPGAPTAGGSTSLGVPVGGQLHVMMLDNFPPPDNVYIKHYTSNVTCDVEPEPGIRVRPGGIDFGDVGVKGSAFENVQLENIGDAPLTISEVTLLSEGNHFALVAPPVPPIVLLGGESATLQVGFSPFVGGDLSGSLSIASDDPDKPLLSVLLAGTGRTLAEQARDLVTAFDKGVLTGGLSGTGRGNSAVHRLAALRAMLVEAASFVEAESIQEACGQLYAVILHADGEPRPGDFVEGPAVELLAQRIVVLRDRLECD